jgi:hypothetical protein
VSGSTNVAGRRTLDSAHVCEPGRRLRRRCDLTLNAHRTPTRMAGRKPCDERGGQGQAESDKMRDRTMYDELREGGRSETRTQIVRATREDDGCAYAKDKAGGVRAGKIGQLLGEDVAGLPIEN